MAFLALRRCWSLMLASCCSFIRPAAWTRNRGTGSSCRKAVQAMSTFSVNSFSHARRLCW